MAATRRPSSAPSPAAAARRAAPAPCWRPRNGAASSRLQSSPNPRPPARRIARGWPAGAIGLHEGCAFLVDGEGAALVAGDGGQLVARQACKGVGPPAIVDKGGRCGGRGRAAGVIRFGRLQRGGGLVLIVE